MEEPTSEFLRRPAAIPLNARLRARVTRYRSAATMGSCLRAALILGIGVHVVGLLAALGSLGGLQRASALAARDHLSTQIHTYGEMQPLGVAEDVLPFLLAGLFALFFGIAYANLPRLAGHPSRFRPAWAIGSWFIPVLCLLRPRQVVEEIWAGSESTRPGEAVLPRAGSASLPFMGAWWSAWLLSEALFRLGDRLGAQAHTIGALQFATAFETAAEGLFILAASFLLPIVAATIRRQQTRAAQLGLVATSRPVPTD